MVFIKKFMCQAMVVHAFNPKLGKQRQVDLCESEDSLILEDSQGYILEGLCLKNQTKPKPTKL